MYLGVNLPPSPPTQIVERATSSVCTGREFNITAASRLTRWHGRSPLDDELELGGPAVHSQVHLVPVVANLDCKGTFVAWKERRITTLAGV